ncbi:MAG TPA: hypothetical protein VFG81_16360 [Anaerolineales bacterium]|jgi:hypothetical protein|nr:hypothetical protein [Anaerolineales bacterium]
MLDYQTNLMKKPETLLRAASDLLRVNRSKGFAALNDLFRAGTVPDSLLDGRYAGELVVIDLTPSLTPFFQWITNKWMPWLGKTFDSSSQRGDNIFTKDSYGLARLFNPLYHGFINDTSGTYRGFAFRTYTAPGLFDTDLTVLKIDYNLSENPSLTVRRVLDEVVQLDDHLYLGKAHVRWWFQPKDNWQTVAFFTLNQESS